MKTSDADEEYYKPTAQKGKKSSGAKTPQPPKPK
jgi:hypothetical protein